MTTEAQSFDSRLTIVEYRLDKAEESHSALRKEYIDDHTALRKSLQGIEKNLQTIKWVAIGAGMAFLSQVVGFSKAVSIIKATIGLL